VRLWFPRVTFVALTLILLFEVFTIAPRPDALVLLACAVWMVVPGVVLADRVLRLQTSSCVAAWLVGAALGLGLSVFGLLFFWAADLQGWIALALAPGFTWVLAWLAPRLGSPTLRLPSFDRRDVIALGLILFVVPLVTFAPYDHVREPTEDGEAYRAYFTADFVWAMSVTGELAKGEMPPVNPFLKGEPLRYYWMSHLLSGAIYRNTRGWGVSAEQVILLDGLVFGLAFVSFLYGLARMAGGSPVFSALAVVVVFTANSYEALERVLVLREHGQSVEKLREVNIDAVTRWFYQGMPVDGLQRMLLYQPHHITGYMLALTALWLVGIAVDVTETAVALWAGILLGLALLFSTFTAIIVGLAVGGLYAFRLAARRAWQGMWQCAILGGLPVVVAVALSSVLGYTDPRHGMLMTFGLNPVARHRWPLMLFLSFGPLLFAGISGLLRPGWLKRDGAAATALVVSAIAFYFLADVPDQGGVWVGWRSGHLLLIGFAMVGASTLTAAWKFQAARVPLIVVLVLTIVPAIPTVAIDVYNAQDIDNRAYAATFPWTLIITPPEREALEWIRRATPVDALVQIEPQARHSGTWAYIPAFAERRMAAGLPGSMIPRRPYELATDNVTFGIFRAFTPKDAWEMAHFLGISYLFVGPPERERYSEGVEILAKDPTLFKPVFHNEAVTVYEVAN
jgi:hypothetical protein